MSRCAGRGEGAGDLGFVVEIRERPAVAVLADHQAVVGDDVVTGETPTIGTPWIGGSPAERIRRHPLLHGGQWLQVKGDDEGGTRELVEADAVAPVAGWSEM